MKTKVLLSLILVAGVGSVDASQFDSFTREAQVRTSDAVVVGRVVSVDSFWSAARNVILTDADVEVEEVWKGAPPARIAVRTLGGAVGDVLLEVDGAARFAAGERVVLFLDRRGDRWVPAGMRFGKYDVAGPVRDPFVVGALPPETPGSAELETVSMSLGDLREEVLGMVGGSR